MQITVEGVSYDYFSSGIKTEALRQISFDVPKGQFVCLAGPSGSGKSTLAMLLAGLFLPQAGQVLLNGQAAAKNSVFSGVGMVFQYPEQQLFGETVLEEVSFAAANQGLQGDELKAASYQALQSVGLAPESFADRSPFSLSGGEKRRVAIASLLAVAGEVLIFDEPTAGVDLQGQKWLKELAKAEHQRGKTIIWLTHNMEEVAQLAQRLLVLKQGQLVFDGAPLDLFASAEDTARCGIAQPKGAWLLSELKKRGAPLPCQSLTIDDAVKEIACWVRGDADA